MADTTPPRTPDPRGHFDDVVPEMDAHYEEEDAGGMGWNYRVVLYPDGSGYGLHEVYYDDDHNALYMTKEPASFYAEAGEGPGMVIKALGMAVNDAMRHSVFFPPADWD